MHATEEAPPALDGFFMTRRISSLFTPLIKIFPVPIIAGAIGFILMGIIARRLPLFPEGVILVPSLLAALAFSSWFSSRLKFVRLDSDTLHVSGWFKQSAIPLSEIGRVHYSAGFGLVFVHLKSSSDFGSTIVFTPTIRARIRSMLGARSVAEELRDLVKNTSTESENAK